MSTLLTAPSPAEARTALEARAKGAAFDRLSAFFRAFPTRSPYYVGQHTKRLLRACQAASDAVLDGRCSYTIVIMPPRHGKSDIASRRLPPWHLLRAPDHEIILASYSGNLATDMSLAARRCFMEAAPLYGLRLDESRRQVAAWGTHQGGAVYAVGLGGTITGRGASILVIDDYLKSREEAESLVMRDKVWDSFRNDLWTRLAPAHAVVIPCTRWHEDDLVGRILEAGQNDPDFPEFQVLRCPAQAEDGTWLAPERFSPSWYRKTRAAVGSYAWQALYQGDPQPRQGNLLRVDRVEIEPAAPPNGLWARGWDLASTAKQRVKDDPDFTVGLRAALIGEYLWIDDVVRGQWDAPMRDRIIKQTAMADTNAVHVGMETVAGYKDAGTYLKRSLGGTMGRHADRVPFSIREISPSVDLVARAGAGLEAMFEGRRVKLVRGPWNAAFLAEAGAFPGRHDDQIAALLIALDIARRRQNARQPTHAGHQKRPVNYGGL